MRANNEIRMKTIAKWFVAVTVMTSIVYGGELTEADKKWGGAVEKMIAEGATTISTPVESRAKLAKEIAAKQGRQSQIEKTSTGFKVTVEQKKLAKN